MVCSCTKLNDSSADDVARILGTYSFDGKVENILSVECTETDSKVNFVFSPIFKDKFTTYIDFTISKKHLNKECDVRTLKHNDDYSFRYEDPVWLYSELHELDEGTICVKTLKDGRKDVYLNVLLSDGTPFTLSYTE